MVSTSCKARMRDTLRAERLLLLFTSADRAAAIAGDLTEERGHRGPILFWLDVVRTLSALWRGAVTDAPLRVVMLALSGCALVAGPALVGVAAVALFPGSIGSPVSWIALSFIWCAGALWTGASLVAIAPSRGMAACATLALVGETLLSAFLIRTPRPDLPTVQLALVYATTLVVPALLLVGGAIARRRMILRGIPT
jgi:hypothetical protein